MNVRQGSTQCQVKINTTIIKRLEYNLGAEAEVYEARQKELEGVAMPIMTRLYQQVMPGGGIVCMPGMSGMGGAASCFQTTH
jgi:hypothetical protein